MTKIDVTPVHELTQHSIILNAKHIYRISHTHTHTLTESNSYINFKCLKDNLATC